MYNSIINNWYENGDSSIKVLSIIETNEEPVYVCLRYSSHHAMHNIENMTETDFKEYYEGNPLHEDNYTDDIIPDISCFL